VFKRLEVPLPERIYGDRELTYPDVGKRADDVGHEIRAQALEDSSATFLGHKLSIPVMLAPIGSHDYGAHSTHCFLYRGSWL
jgi:hypothetical protein